MAKLFFPPVNKFICLQNHFLKWWKIKFGYSALELTEGISENLIKLIENEYFTLY